MFPSESTERLEKAVYATGDVEKAIDYIIGTVNKGEDKKHVTYIKFSSFCRDHMYVKFFSHGCKFKKPQIKIN